MSTAAFSQCCLLNQLFSMPTNGTKYWGGNTVSFSHVDSMVPALHCFLFCLHQAVLPHASMPRYPRHTVFFWCLCVAFDTMTHSYHSKIQASLSSSFLLSHLVVMLEGQIPLSEMQRCSWFPPGQHSAQRVQPKADKCC